MTRSKRQVALHEIAEAYGTPYGERTDIQHDLTRYGICSGMYVIGIYGDECDNELIDALKAVGSLAMLCPYRGWSDWTPFCDLWRCDLASFLAAMTDEEYNEAFGVEV